MWRPPRPSSTRLGRILEDGLEFRAPLAQVRRRWFFDQAANRRALPKYVRSGARVLDVFSYVGAWGVRAARSGAREVLCVDSSAAALELAVSNAERNQTQVTAVRGDAFDVLEEMGRSGARFDLVVIDPPAFAKRKKETPKALAAYKRLNQLALQVMADDGILVSCSCSHHVSPEELQDAIAKAAGGRKSTCRSWRWAANRRTIRCIRDSRDSIFESLFLPRE